MRILLDTNILLRLSDQDHQSHSLALNALASLDAGGHECVIVPQVLYEYWVVATRPLENNGLGLDPPVADLNLSDWTSIFRLLLDERGVYTHWQQLVTIHSVRGKNAHDARLVAASQRHGVSLVLTFNKADFQRYSEIRALTPEDIINKTAVI